MGRVSKSTKKFQKNGLKKTIDQRRKVQQYNQKISKGKKKGSNGSKSVEPKKDDGEVFEDMSVEDFMKGGFEVPEEKKEQKKKHKQDLDKLAETDPEFFNYLKENDQALLEFDPEESSDSEDDDEDDVEAGSDDDNQGDEEAEEGNEEASNEVTLKDVKHWKTLLEEKSLTTLKKVFKAFSAAVHYSEDDDSVQFKYVVTNPDVFNKLLVLTLSQAPIVLQHHIPLNKEKMPTDNKKSKNISQALKSFGSSLNTLLKGTSHTNQTIQLILKSIQETLPYFLSHRKIIKNLTSTISDVFSSTAEDDTRLAAFAVLEHAASVYPKSMLEPILKATYGGIVKSSRRTNIHNMPGINMQKNLTATLYEIDPTVSYQNGFQFIRQLAVHLRSSIVNKTAESYKQVYNWQFVHSLDFWSRVLSSTCDTTKESVSGKASPLRELIHPLVQVTLGAIRLIPTATYFPLRFYLTRGLIRLSRHSGVYIPLVPVLTEILTSSAITKSPKASTLAPLDFDHNIRAGKSYIGSRVYQDGITDQFIELMSEFYALHCKSVAFPELCIPVVISLKRFTKRSKNIKFNKQLQQFVDRLDQNAKMIEKEREKADFGPTNREKVAAFLKDVDWTTTPLGKYVVTQREVREERARILRESAEADREDAKADQDDEDAEMLDFGSDNEDESASEEDDEDDE